MTPTRARDTRKARNIKPCILFIPRDKAPQSDHLPGDFPICQYERRALVVRLNLPRARAIDAAFTTSLSSFVGTDESSKVDCISLQLQHLSPPSNFRPLVPNHVAWNTRRMRKRWLVKADSRATEFMLLSGIYPIVFPS